MVSVCRFSIYIALQLKLVVVHIEYVLEIKPLFFPELPCVLALRSVLSALLKTLTTCPYGCDLNVSTAQLQFGMCEESNLLRTSTDFKYISIQIMQPVINGWFYPPVLLGSNPINSLYFLLMIADFQITILKPW